MYPSYLSEKKLKEFTNTLSKEAFGNPYPYPIVFVDPSEVESGHFYPYAEIPVGDDEECLIEISKIMRHVSPRSFVLCILSCLKDYNDWWNGYESQYYITQERLDQFIRLLENI